MGPKRSVLIITGVAFAALVFLAGYADAYAADGCAKSVTYSGQGVISTFITDLLKMFECQPKTWTETLRTLATRLFWLLVSIELSWTAISMALRGSELGEWLNTIVNKIFFIGFFGALLQFSSTWAEAIVKSFQQAGNVAGKAAAGQEFNAADPGSIFDLGIDTAVSVVQDVGGIWATAYKTISGDFSAIALIVAAFIILMVFIAIAVNMFITLVESYVVIAACVLMTGFGGSRWTKDYAQKILTYALSVGAKLFMMELIVSLGISIVKEFTTQINQSPFPAGESKTALALAIIGVGIVFYQISKSIPEFVQGLLNGTAPTSSGEKAFAGMMPSPWGVMKGGTALGISGGMATWQVGRAVLQGFRTPSGEFDLSAKGLAKNALLAVPRLGGTVIGGIWNTAHKRMTWEINPGFGNVLGQFSNQVKVSTDKEVAEKKSDATIGRGGQLAQALTQATFMASLDDNDERKREYAKKFKEQLAKERKQSEQEKAQGQTKEQSEQEKARAALRPLSAQQVNSMVASLQANEPFAANVTSFMTRVEQFGASRGTLSADDRKSAIDEMQKLANELTSGDSRSQSTLKQEQDMIAKWAQRQVTKARRDHLAQARWYSRKSKNPEKGGGDS